MTTSRGGATLSRQRGGALGMGPSEESQTKVASTFTGIDFQDAPPVQSGSEVNRNHAKCFFFVVLFF